MGSKKNMTKLYEAYKKRALGQPGFELAVSSLGGVNLFPQPPREQLNELCQLADMITHLKPADRSGIAICFASTIPGEGASYVSYNTACIIAHVFSRKVAWVDTNFKSPQHRLMLDDRITLVDMLHDSRCIDDLPVHQNPVLVGGGLNLGSHISRYDPGRMDTLLRQFTERFEFTVLDCPPILDCIETIQMAAASDGLVVVIERGRLKREVIQHGLANLVKRRVNILGAVLNRRKYELPKIIYERL